MLEYEDPVREWSLWWLLHRLRVWRVPHLVFALPATGDFDI